MTVTISNEDVIRIMMQFCAENGLMNTLSSFHSETGVTLNSVDNCSSLLANVRAGEWDAVLTIVAPLQLSYETLVALHEQVIMELLESGAKEIAKELMICEPLVSLKHQQLSRWRKLDHLCTQSSAFSITNAYEVGTTKLSRREFIAKALENEVTSASTAPSRLINLLNIALNNGNDANDDIPSGNWDLLHNTRRTTIIQDPTDKVINTITHTSQVDPEAHAEALTFSLDGLSLALGCVDGVVDIWDPELCKQRDDLGYQAEGKLLGHSLPVLCCKFSNDDTMIVSGCQDGEIRVWKLDTGVLLRKFPNAHLQGITCLSFSEDNTQILSGSFDQTACIHGMKSGKTIREFRGHKSYVNTACYVLSSSDMITTSTGTGTGNVVVVTGSSDGTIKLWNSKTSECINTFCPNSILNPNHALKECPIHTVHIISNNDIIGNSNSNSNSNSGSGLDLIYACSRDNKAYLMTMNGTIVRTFSISGASANTNGNINTDYICSAVSQRCKYAYCLAENGSMHVFEIATGSHVDTIELGEQALGTNSNASNTRCDVIGMIHHPMRNIIATFSENGKIRILKAE
jgi:WD40 repeat-containing protein SMU1